MIAMTVQNFKVANIALKKGSYAIEANAGTGKTHTITMLVLRFVVEQGVGINNLLVVTFTNAATAELKERVRLKLLEAQQALSGFYENLDEVVIAWVKNLSVDKLIAQQRLNNALLNFDQTAIFTIHGFCQRTLKDFALESGQLFDCDLTSDVSELRLQITEDYWRKELHLQSLWVVSLLTQKLGDPKKLLASVKGINAQEVVYPEMQSLARVVDSIEKNIAVTKVNLSNLLQKLNENKAYLNKNYFAGLGENYKNLNSWLYEKIVIFPDQALLAFTSSGVEKGLNGHKFKAKENATNTQQKQEYLKRLEIDTSYVDQLQRSVANLVIMFRRNLVERLRVEQDKKLQQLNKLSFDSLILRLEEALQAPNNESIKTGLQQLYQVALIDEFQDTDQAQWNIFSTLFMSPKHSLYLIGDPKQAIYKFRGADLFSYFKARKSVQFNYSLSGNWRSYPHLVTAVNQLFSKNKQAFSSPLVQYQQSYAERKAEQGELQKQGKPMVPMVLWQLNQPSSDIKKYWTLTLAKKEVRIAVVNEIIALLQKPVTITTNIQNRKLLPQDIVILVRTNEQAREYQNELYNAGVPSVFNSTESVFATDEAKEIFCLLRAISHPSDLEFLRQALTLSWFALGGHDLYIIVNDEQALEQWMVRFQSYYDVWCTQGLMAMMHALLAQEQVEAKLAKKPTTERKLTNIHHLLELLQQAIIKEHLGLHKTLDYLQIAMTKNHHNDEHKLRLESDEQAVKIVTLHRCKGLEYPVVFCPMFWHRSNLLKQEKNLISCHEDGQMIVDLGSDKFEQRKDQAIAEELAEDLRLLYVALTRAKLRCYLVWVDARTQNKTNISALAYLLFNGFSSAEQKNFSTQQNVLQNLSKQYPACFTYGLLATKQQTDKLYLLEQSNKALSSRQQQRNLKTIWRLTSYTDLSALSITETIENTIDKTQEEYLASIPRGTHVGNVIHQLLETIDFAELVQNKNIALARDKSCQRYGLSMQQPALIDALLTRAVTTALSPTELDFSLANLSPKQCIKEMPFFYKFNEINSSKINSILANSTDFKPLSGRTMQGLLVGFIDLICSYQGRFYVIDYKTNSLDNYEHNALADAMLAHNYGLQYWLYSLVLHQYLQQRMPNYNYQKHFGGVRYLFVRGMFQERPGSGVYAKRPDLATLECLANFFQS